MPVFEFSKFCRIHYLDVNITSPNPVLLLHGLGANSESWLFQIPVLQECGFRPITPDAPGFGQSTYSGGRADIKNFTEPIAALIDHLQLPSLDVVGISMGGTIALQLALDHTQYVSRLVLINTFAHLNVIRARSFPYYLLRFFLVHTLGLERQAKTVAKHLFPFPDQELLRQGLTEQIRQSDPHAYRAAMRALARFDVRDRLGEIHCPALVITGRNDTTVPVEIQFQLASGIKDSRQILIDKAGHAVTAETPDIFNQVLVEFLST